MSNVTDQRDTRTLIPRLRRAIEGPTGTGSSLSDDQINAIGADAIGAIILYSNSLFGSELQVSERDPKYMAPVAWLTDPALSEPQATAIVSQAALDYWFMQLSSVDGGGKVLETIADESTNWSWEISPQSLVERLRQLRADRDAALEALQRDGEALDASYTSYIGVRDNWTSRLIEPWVEHGGVAQGGLNPLEFV
jgi:hypothetical protein